MSALISDFHQYMKNNGASESHQNNCLKTNMSFATFLGPKVTFYDIRRKQDITQFLDSKIKSADIDPDKRWITTWNDYLNDIKCFLRWLFNEKMKKMQLNGDDIISRSDWETPAFLRIKAKKGKRTSPYLETELWERDELLLVVKYELFKRNKVALTLFWDLDARNHEVTLLKIKHIRLRDRYGEGEIPHEAKTGTGPILLTCSFPYVRDWLNEHPFKNTHEAKLICNLHTGGTVKPEALWTMMKQLRKRIFRLLQFSNHEDKLQQPQIGATQEGNSVIVNETSSNTNASSDDINQFHDQSDSGIRDVGNNEAQTTIDKSASYNESSTIDDFPISGPSYKQTGRECPNCLELQDKVIQLSEAIQRISIPTAD